MNAAERIYVASTHAGQASARLADGLARRMEDDIATSSLLAGGVLGSLRDLSERYAVGRSVAREAVGLLERRGLGRLRPGPCGGFVLATPQPRAIGEELAAHFRDIGVTLQQLIDAREAIDLMAARLAAAAEPAAPQLLRLGSMQLDDLEGLLQARLEIARLAAEPVLLLFVECLNSLTRDFACAVGHEPCGAPMLATAMCRALRAGDAQTALAEGTRMHRLLIERLAERTQTGRAMLADGQQKIPDRGPAVGRLATNIAYVLATEILRGGSTGARLGSEWDLCERFSVSRLTLRQAIRLLQDRGLVECRRGRGNGLVVLDRRASGAIRLVLAYLIGGKLNPMTAGTLLFQLNCFIPALAVSRASDDQRHQLEAALTCVESCDPFDRCDLLELVHCVSRAADSPIIDLFSRCLAAYEARFRPVLAERLPASTQASYFKHMRALLDDFATRGVSGLPRAKSASCKLMLEMSDRRPI